MSREYMSTAFLVFTVFATVVDKHTRHAESGLKVLLQSRHIPMDESCHTYACVMSRYPERVSGKDCMESAEKGARFLMSCVLYLRNLIHTCGWYVVVCGGGVLGGWKW